MGSYYFVSDPESEFGYTPIPGEDYTMAILTIAKRKGVKISEEMIFEEIKKSWKIKKRKS